MAKTRIAMVLLVIAMLTAYAGPALAADVTVPTNAIIPSSGGNPNPIVKNVWVFDKVDWQNGAVMTGSPAAGGGSGTGSGGGIGGGGCAYLLGVVDPNGNNLASMAARGWIGTEADAAMTLLSKADAAIWIGRAFSEGFITASYRDLLMMQVANSGAWGIYIIEPCLTYHHPAGSYNGFVKAVAGSAWNELSSPFTYLDVVAMDIDYASIGWGSVMPAATKVVAGDYDWGTGLPTAQNLGNVPLRLAFMYGQMTKSGGTSADVLTQFDLEFQASSWADAGKEIWDPVAAAQTLSLSKPFPICNRAKMNFSVHAPSNIQDGTYAGNFKITFAKY